MRIYPCTPLTVTIAALPKIIFWISEASVFFSHSLILQTVPFLGYKLLFLGFFPFLVKNIHVSQAYKTNKQTNTSDSSANQPAN